MQVRCSVPGTDLAQRIARTDYVALPHHSLPHGLAERLFGARGVPAHTRIAEGGVRGGPPNRETT